MKAMVTTFIEILQGNFFACCEMCDEVRGDKVYQIK